jgi:hypothetical protein
MEPINQTLFALVLHAHNTFDGLTPWLIAVAFFISWFSLVMVVANVIGHLLGKVTTGDMYLAMWLGAASFTISGGAFLWFIGV